MAKDTNVGHTAQALREAGFVPVPRWWVRPEELDVIGRIARNHEHTVTEIRNKAWNALQKETKSK